MKKIEALERLAKLRSEGALSEEDYELAKREVIRGSSQEFKGIRIDTGDLLILGIIIVAIFVLMSMPLFENGNKPVSAPEKHVPEADIIITKEMIRTPISYEDAISAPSHLTICRNRALTISNGANEILNLQTAPDRSDDIRDIGTVKPYELLKFTQKEEGFHFLMNKDNDNLIAGYEVLNCKPDN
jgi:hypothetical protein